MIKYHVEHAVDYVFYLLKIGPNFVGSVVIMEMILEKPRSFDELFSFFSKQKSRVELYLRIPLKNRENA